MESNGRNSIIGGAGGVLTLASWAVLGPRLNPPLWTNAYWIWAISVCAVFLLLGFWETFAPRAKWWMPPVKNTRFWSIAAYIVFAALVGVPVGLLALQYLDLWVLWLPWTLVAIFAIVCVIQAFKRNAIRGGGESERREEQKSETMATASQESENINPLDTHFYKKAIRVADLVADWTNLMVMDKFFEECRLVGPAVICAVNSNLLNNRFLGSVDSIFIVIDQDLFSGVVMFDRCTFK
ncbi:MAG: hypothetical protein WB615_13845, partial [Candidatus Tumulicola sp.]